MSDDFRPFIGLLVGMFIGLILIGAALDRIEKAIKRIEERLAPVKPEKTK